MSKSSKESSSIKGTMDSLTDRYNKLLEALQKHGQFLELHQDKKRFSSMKKDLKEKIKEMVCS